MKRLREMFERARSSARERKGRSATLAILMIVLAAVMAKGFLSGGPRTGRASPSAPVVSGSLSSVAEAGQQAVTRAIASKDAMSRGRYITIAAAPRSKRNVFGLDPAHFPPKVQAKPSESPDPSSLSAQPTPVVSSAKNADDDPERRAARLVDETKTWRLKSVILGQRPLAVIETGSKQQRSAVVREGDEVLGWRLAEISLTSVVMEKESVRVRLTLALPDR